jgi:hypothetical protein
VPVSLSLNKYPTNLCTMSNNFRAHMYIPKKVQNCAKSVTHPLKFIMPRKSKLTPAELVIRKTILFLNNDLRMDVSIYWVTAEELWRRLIHSGVRKSLTLIMVQKALKQNNKDQEHLKVWQFGRGVTWFQLAMVNHCESNELPLGQCVKVTANKMYRLNICPVKNYFVGSENKHFITLNNALLELKEDEGK